MNEVYTIVEHKKEYVPYENDIIHTVIIKCEAKPLFRDIAISVGYNPFGYDSKEISTIQMDKNTWVVEFTSWSCCD